MPRLERTKSETKIYHIIIRGINKQDIFLDKQDFLKYIKEIEITKEKYQYEIYAYAFMNDHVHFIIYDKNNNISLAIQSLNVRYSAYFNKKYERTGHLFENRFKSKVIEKADYLRSVVRYIHKNPENAGMKPYIRTSYNEYINKSLIINEIPILKVFGSNKKEAIRNFMEFHNNYCKNQDYDKDFELYTRITDDEAIKIIKEILKEENLLRIQGYDKDRKYNAIEKITKIEGITKEQISRIIGVSRKTITKIKNEFKK